MKVADGVEMLEISAVVMGMPMTIHPTLLWDNDAVVLVDSGLPGQLELMRQAAAQAGAPLEKLTAVILTHQDIDHIGGLPAILGHLPHHAEVLASGPERPYIQGERRLLKMTPEAVDRAVASLPPGVPEERKQAFRAALENPPKSRVDRTVADGEELPYCGGISVIVTPGHTPGHLCLYHRPSKTLIAGDAMHVTDGQLLGPDPRATLDLDEARRSLRKLSGYQIERVICYHGGLYQGDVNRRIAELVSD